MDGNPNSGPGASRRQRITAWLIASWAAGGLVAGAGGAVPGSTPSAAAAAAALVRLPGHVHRLAQTGVDAGEAPDTTRMHGLDLVLAKTPAQQKTLDQLLAAQQDPKSPQYHHWLTPAEFGRRFGASDAAVHALSQWLRSYGLEVGEVPASRAHLPFFGSKAQVEAAFHTQIHLIDVQDERHYANVADPLVPASVQPLIRAVRGLNDFNPKPGVRPAGRNLPHPNTYYPGPGQYPGYVGPSDFAVIYNLKPLYQENITGVGVTVAIAAQSDVDASVLTSYWAAFGVAGSSFGLPAQSFTSMPVPPADGGTDPGKTLDGNEDEAYLDSEILGALAPGATLLLVRDVSAANAAQYVIDKNLAAVLNISFGTCEGAEASDNAMVSSMYQQAVSEGITITVSSSDAGVAACTAKADTGKMNDVNSNGFAVNGLASTPYDLAVGGTDFNPNTETSYWNTANQPATFESAVSHIPEMVWNDSCANPVFAQAYGSGDAIVFCNTATIGTAPNTVANPFILISGDGGGLSSCTASDNSGNCTGGYAQPSWQANVAGITNFGTRALPDVSMIATRWLVCSYENTTCNPANAPFTSTPSTITVLEGTSASAPSVAAIVAMLDQSQITGSSADGRQGLINPKLYKIAGIEYGSAATLATCSADQGGITSPACVFYDIVSGSNAQPCKVSSYASSAQGSLPASTCANESNASYQTGIMEISGTQDYAAAAGFDIATGLGSINAAGLVSAFQASAAPTGLSAAEAGTTVTLTWHADVSATSGFDIYQGASSGQESSTPVKQNVGGTTTMVTGLPPGLTYYFEIAAVTVLGVSPLSNEAKATLAPAAPTRLAAAAAGAGSLTLTWTASTGATSYNLFEGTSAGGEGGTASKTNISGATVALTDLTPGQQYFFKLQALNAGGTSAESAEASATVVPASPTALAATAGNAAVSLTWSAAAGAKTYNVYEAKSTGAEGSTPVMTGLTSPSASVTGLSNGTTYYFTVGAVDAGGVSAPSAEAHATPAAPGGGGAMDWIGLGALAAIAASSRRTPSSRRRAEPHHCR
jgi:hypothetical protein